MYKPTVLILQVQYCAAELSIHQNFVIQTNSLFKIFNPIQSKYLKILSKY